MRRQTSPVTAFVLPMTVRAAGVDVDLLVELPGPMRLDEVLPDIRRSAGLPENAVLNLGVGPDAGRWVALDAHGVVIGRDPACDLTLDDPELSRRHARISCIERGTLITDLNSVNGLRVDGRERSVSDAPVTVPLGGLIRLGGSIFRAGFDSEPTLLLTPDGKGHLTVARPARVARSFDHPLPPPVGPMPERSRRPIPLLAALAGALAGGAIAAITGIWTFLLLAGLGPLMMLVSALSDRASGRRSHRRALAEHQTAQRVEAEQI